MEENQSDIWPDKYGQSVNKLVASKAAAKTVNMVCLSNISLSVCEINL